MTESACTCDQRGDYCLAHLNCACGCPKHAHSFDGPCVAGSMNCHGCASYRPAKLKRFHEMDDDAIEHATHDELKLAYKDLRAHHVEETTALWAKLKA